MTLFETQGGADRIAAARPFFTEDDQQAILDATREILKSGRLILGDYTREFESQFRRYVGVPHAVAVSSCTAALQITLRFLGSRGSEVVLPTNNFPGVVSAALYEGLDPVLADMDPQTFCIDIDDAIRRVTPRTAGFVVVHIAGLIPPEIDRLRNFAADHRMFFIEDASHAHGAEIDGRRAGSLADAGCFSFYPTKILTTGTGGMITTEDARLADYARSVRHHGQGPDRVVFLRQGNSWCMGEIQAAMGLRQLGHLDENVRRRNQIVARYRDQLDGEPWVEVPLCPENIRHAYYKFPVLLGEEIDTGRMRRILEEEHGIENGTIYDPPCHLQPLFRDRFAASAGTYPNAERFLSRQFCPPMHACLSDGDVDRVVRDMRLVASRSSGKRG